MTDSASAKPRRIQAFWQGRPYFAINVRRILNNALDVEKSDCTINKVIKQVTAVRKYHLTDERLDGSPIFKLHELRRLWVYVTEDFKNVVETAGLVGLGFKHIWTSGDSECKKAND
jgi:hypothetical protein